MVALALALVHSIEDPFHVVNTCQYISTCAPRRCFLLGGNLQAFELQGCDNAKWGEMSEAVHATVSQKYSKSHNIFSGVHVISKCNMQLV